MELLINFRTNKCLYAWVTNVLIENFVVVIKLNGLNMWRRLFHGQSLKKNPVIPCSIKKKSDQPRTDAGDGHNILDWNTLSLRIRQNIFTDRANHIVYLTKNRHITPK